MMAFSTRKPKRTEIYMNEMKKSPVQPDESAVKMLRDVAVQVMVDEATGVMWVLKDGKPTIPLSEPPSWARNPQKL
jgi:hypothetical protein